MSQLSEWSPYDSFVQGGLGDGQFMNAAYMLLAAGPPRLSSVGGAEVLAAMLSAESAGANEIAYPIGMAQNFNLSHNMSVQRMFELGSVRSYFIPGRVMGQAGLSRVMYHGPSLLRVLWAYYQDLVTPTVVASVFPNIGASTVFNPHDVKIPPGYENVFLNLMSDLFTQPVGLLQMMKDSNEDTMAANYLEACYVPSHTIATDAMGTIIQENVAIQFERLVPIRTAVVGLVSGL